MTTFLDLVRKGAQERKQRDLIMKGGKGSGWYAPPKGTHTAESKGKKAKGATLKEIRSKLGIKSSSSKRAKLPYDFVMGLSDVMPFSTRQAIYGVERAIQTGRLAANAEMAIRRMTTWDFTKLLAQIVDADISQNDIPRWLNQKF